MFSELVLIFFHDEGFKDVAFLEVPELFERNTAFVAFGNFLYVILEPLPVTMSKSAPIGSSMMPSKTWKLL